MRKKFFKVALMAAVVAVAGYGVYQTQQEGPMSEVMLANVEALARGEGDRIYCCGNNGDCMEVLGPDGSEHIVAGLKLSVPCP